MEPQQQQQDPYAAFGGKSIAPAYAGAFVTPGSNKPAGLVEPGNLDLNNRPKIDNHDGTRSTVYSMSSEFNGKEVLYPGVGDGKTYPLRKLTQDEAIDQYRKTGKHLGIFETPEQATAYANTLHEDQAAQTEDPYAAFGGKAIGDAPVATPPAAPEEGLGTKVVGGVKDLLRGADKSIISGAKAVGDFVQLPGGDGRKNSEIIDSLVDKHAPDLKGEPTGFLQKTGAFMEQAAEYAFGEGEARASFEALPAAEQLKKLQPVMAFLEKHPTIARYVKAGKDALKTGTINAATGTAQAAAHGASAEDAIKEGLETGITAGAVHGAASTVGAIREGATKKVADMARRQPEAQKMVKDVARNATRGALDRLNAPREAQLAVTGAEVTPARFQPVNAEEISNNVHSFGDAAEQVRAHAKPVYEKLDELSKGRFSEIRMDLTKANKAKDAKGIRTAQEKLDKILETHKDDVNAEDYQAAKDGWRDAKILDKLHNAVEGSFNGISEEMAGAGGTSERALKPDALQNRIGKLLTNKRTADEVERVIGKEGVQNLYRSSYLVNDPALRKPTMALAMQVAAKLGMHAGMKVAGGAAVEPALFVLRKMATNPHVGELMDYAVRHNATPEKAAALIASAIAGFQDYQ